MVGFALLLLGSLISTAAHAATSPQTARAETGFDWPEYGHDPTGSGYTADTGITAQNAPTLAARPGWPVRSASQATISAQPIVAGGFVYWGTWDGVVHATPVNGGPGGWTTSLGTLSYPPPRQSSGCGKRLHGVADAGVFQANLLVNGVFGPVLFIAGGGNDSAGGGWAQMYALNALTGTVLWHTPIAPSPDVYLWSSPIFYHAAGRNDPSVYEGVADVGEPCPFVRGEVVQLDALTGQVENTFYTAPTGCTGATVWGSLTVEANAVYAVTGNRGFCRAFLEPYAYSIVKLDASTLTVVDSWQIPASERSNSDVDFGSVPILFSRVLNGKTQLLVGAPNKNGIFYVWNRNDLAKGPLYRLRVANPLSSDIAPAAFDGKTLYIGTTKTTVGGTTQPGSVRAFQVDNLPRQAWETTLRAPVLASLSAAPGIVVVGSGQKTWVLNAVTGGVLTTLQTELVGQTRGQFWSAPVIANGVVYEGDTQGVLYSYSPAGF